MPHSDAYLTSLYHLAVNHMSYSYRIHQYKVLRGLQLRVEGHHEVYKGSSGCLGCHVMGWGEMPIATVTRCTLQVGVTLTATA